MSEQKIYNLAKKFEDKIIEIRHKIHRYPELAFEEKRTAALAAEIMKDLGFEVKKDIYHTGVSGLLGNTSKKEVKTILLRADMDALPIEEKTGLPYSSEVPGVMHACGHDGHTAILLGTAMILDELKNDFEGNVKFIFQPAEEAEGGAEGMIKEGVLKNPDVDAALGLHLWGNVPSGVVEYKKGPFMASPDKFEIIIKGRGGHAAQPHNCVDPVPIASSIIEEFQKIVSRRTDPLESVVISICHLEGGTTYNVIPDNIMLEGTVRSLTPEIRESVPEIMREVVEKITAMNNAEYNFDFEYRFPPLINDENMTELVKSSAQKIIGKKRVREAQKPNMGGEDFSYFAREVPASFFYLGIAPSDKESINHHHPEFKVDDSVLKDGSAVMAQAVIDYFKEQN
ncbi:MAG: M20 metallopeptidase family protein [Halanaerobiales bacterium]